MVEATNKEIKYRYLILNNIPNQKQLEQLMPGFINDFNSIRPHGKLNGAIPNEVYAGIETNKEDLKSILQKVQAKRPLENRKSQCGTCI